MILTYCSTFNTAVVDVRTALADLDMDSDLDVRLQVQDHMDVKERAHDFCFTFEDDEGHGEQVYMVYIGTSVGYRAIIEFHMILMRKQKKLIDGEIFYRKIEGFCCIRMKYHGEKARGWMEGKTRAIACIPKKSIFRSIETFDIRYPILCTGILIFRYTEFFFYFSLYRK